MDITRVCGVSKMEMEKTAGTTREGSADETRAANRQCGNEMSSSETSMDDFDLFCKQAGWKRRLSHCSEYGGSLPCLPPDGVHGSTNRDGSGSGGRGHTPVGTTLSSEGNGYLVVPEYANMRRAQSDGGHGQGLSRLADEPIPKPARKSGPERLWSSIKSLVDSCEGSPQCLTPDSPPYFCFDYTRTFEESSNRCSSAPHSRSTSLKKKRKCPATPVKLMHDLGDEIRPRTSSLPSKGPIKRPNKLPLTTNNTLQVDNPFDGEDWLRVRHFVTTPKGIINCGDAFRSKSCSSSLRSLGSCGSGGVGEGSVGSCGSLGSAEGAPCTLKVAILGADGVGKTTLAQQFLTSECLVEKESLHEFEDSTTVSVLLDGEEAIIEVVEIAAEEDHRHLEDVEAYLVVFSTVDRLSFHQALDLLYNIRKEEMRDDALILVANKTDLVRIRQVAEQECKSAAENYHCKYTEVSALMNLKVDELLAGIVNQIRLHRRAKTLQVEKPKSPGCGRRSPIPRLFNRILKRQCMVSKSCDNLQVL